MKERKFRLVAVTLGIAGVLLLTVSIGLYALGLYSSSQLDNLNVTSNIPVSTPVIPIVVPNTPIARELNADQKIKPILTSSKKYIDDTEAKATPLAKNLDQKTQFQKLGSMAITAKSDPLLKTETNPHLTDKNIDNLLSGYSSDNFVSEMHPRDWADPRWSESDKQIVTPLDFPPHGKINQMLPEDFLGKAITIRIPAIKVDSSIKQLEIIEKNGIDQYETPKN
ncbi:uncharacterized protein METZ01_LOCUS471018, partial [marine metagenome]